MTETIEDIDPSGRDLSDAQKAFRASKGLVARPSGSKKARPLNPDKPLWNRQPQEGMAAYEGFMVFLAMGKERTASKVAETQGCSTANISRWMGMWSWAYRVAAYEEHYMLLRLEDIEAKRDDMFAQQEGLALTALALVGGQFESMLESMRKAIEDGEKYEGLKGDTLVRLFDTAAKVQRMAVMGKIANLADVQEREEKLAEAHSQELADLIGAFMNDLELTPDQQEKAQEVLKARLLG